jgi:DNA-binding transcriptional LysR family regulator
MVIAGWDHYRSFLAVARRGSLSAAARELELTQPTLGRHIAALEEALGTDLFTRSQSGLHPTPAALELMPHAEAMAASAEAMQRAASAEAKDARGAVRLTASEMVGVQILPPMLTAFRTAHPQIEIELMLSNLTQDLLRREADIAVRMTEPTQKALISRKLGKIAVGLYAHRDYLARHGTPKAIDDLAHHAVIGFDADSSAFRSVRGMMAVSREMFAFRTDNDHAQLAMLRAGFGIAGCQAGIAARDRNLVPVLPGKIALSIDVWLVMHEDLRNTRRVRLLYDHLARALGAYLAHQGRKKPR